MRVYIDSDGHWGDFLGASDEKSMNMAALGGKSVLTYSDPITTGFTVTIYVENF